jgi:hypothetical protein
MVIFQLNVVYNWPNKLPLKSMDEKSSPSIAQARVLSFISHKMALAAITQKRRTYVHGIGLFIDTPFFQLIIK